MKLRRSKLMALSIAALTLAVPAVASAQDRAAAGRRTADTAIRPLPEIPLDDHTGADTEQWETASGARSVRNVTHATLTPFLPAANIATGAAVIVAPGGAFVSLSMDNEGAEVARWFASKGIAAFVLKYRLQPTPRDPKVFEAMAVAMLQMVTAPGAPMIVVNTPPQALADGQSALKLVRSQAATFGVDPKRVGFVGFSAGGILAMSVALAEGGAERPDFVGNIYGPMEGRDVPSDAPPMFLAVALDDPLATRGPLSLISSYRAAKRPVEAHMYSIGGHGFGMNSKGAAAALWTDEMYAWLKDLGLLPSVAKR